MSTLQTSAVGSALSRVEGREKVTGAARYAFEHPVEGAVYCSPITATIAAGEIGALDPARALARPSVLAVLWADNAPRLEPVDDAELAVLQSRTIAYRGQIIGAVIAESLETAREAAALVDIEYAPRRHDVVLREDHPRLYAPDKVNPSFPTDTSQGDAEDALNRAEVVHDAIYRTPAFHNNPMEPHAGIAVWEGGRLTIYDSTQGPTSARARIAEVFGLDTVDVRIISPHVGGGFGSKGLPRPHIVLAALAARVAERPVKLAVTRQQMFALVGYRTPTIQRVRLGATNEGHLTAITHEAFEQSSTVKEFAEQTAAVTRVMYAAPNRSTSHRLVRLDVPTPSWMRAPGECPGMYALESALDELAVACGVDPIELRIRNEPDTEPESGRAWSSRNLVGCLREGAERFGWPERDPTPGIRRDGRWLVGTGVASSTYPAYQMPASASARALGDGGFLVRITAADIGTGARTVLTQIAADALGVAPEQVRVEIGDSDLPPAGVAGGSMGTASWGTAVVKACRALVDAGGEGEVTVDTTEDLAARADLARHAFGAQFVEARVNIDTGEVRLPRVLGVFAVGRIINPKTARSQFLGGMTMGLSMALHEESVMDAEFGDYLNHDFAQYHIASNADVQDIEAAWLDEDDDELNPMGSKGIGEIGIVGTAAAVANAVYHATGVRVRELPIRLDRVLAGLSAR